MNKVNRTVVLVTLLSMILFMGWVEREHRMDKTAGDVLEEKQEVWIRQLIQCESTGNPNAINPNDSDGTPSYGLLQFKPSTFEMFSRKYKIKGELMDPVAQKEITRRMINDPKVRIENQFPACVKRYGRPPQE